MRENKVLDEISLETHCSIKVLISGGVVLIPTDTVIGLCCLPNNENAINKVFELKNRDRLFNLPVMVSSITQIESLGLDLNTASRLLMKSKYMPGPLTIVFGFSDLLERPEWLNSRVEVAVRMPNDKRLLDVINQTGPILMTSANKHGSKLIHESEVTIIQELNGLPDYIVKGKRKIDLPSTIVNTRTSIPKIERIGAVSEVEIDNILKSTL